MQEGDKKNIKDLIRLVKELCEQDSFNWLKKELIDYFSLEIDKTLPNKKLFNNGYEFDDFPSFLRFQKNQFRKKGRRFYERVDDAELKNILINDYVEMNWNLFVNNIDRFMLFNFYQLENLLNYYCQKNDAEKKIKNNNQAYKFSSTNEKFNVDFENLKTYNSKINLNFLQKIAFWANDSNNFDFLDMNYGNFYDIKNVRDKNSHRGGAESYGYINTITKLLNKDFLTNFNWYVQILNQLLLSMGWGSDSDITERPAHTETGKVINSKLQKIRGVNIVGHISEYNKNKLKK